MENTTMSKLPHDCLHAIFLYLPVVQTIKLREVCSTWRDAADDCWRETKGLQIYCSKRHEAASKIGTTIGGSRKINVTTSSDLVVTTVMQLCTPHLEEFSYRTSRNYWLFSALKEFPNLQKLNISVETRNQDVQMVEILKAHRRLKILEISIFRQHTSLSYLCTDHLEELEVSIMGPKTSRKIDYQFRGILQNVINRCRKLKRLELNLFNGRDFPDLRECTSVTHLSFHDYESERNYFTYDTLSSIAKLSNLRILFISILAESAVNDEFLINLSEHCRQLEDIDFCMGCEVTDRGVWALSQLPQLRELHMEVVPRITDKCLSYFRTIEVLGIRQTDMTNASVVELLTNCLSLKRCGLYGDNIEVDDLWISLLKSLKERGKTALMDFSVNGEQIVINGAVASFERE